MGIDEVGIDKVGIDKVGIDKVGIDKVGIDEVGRYPNKGVKVLHQIQRPVCQPSSLIADTNICIS